MLKFAFSLLFFAITSTLIGQTCKIVKGSIFDFTTENPREDVAIQLLDVGTDLTHKKAGKLYETKSDENGKFWLQTLDPNDGAIPGNYKIAFKYVPEIVPDMPGFSGGVQSEKSPIPLKYGDENKSGITAKVESNASKNDFKFDLN